jgi:hypothetical protein
VANPCALVLVGFLVIENLEVALQLERRVLELAVYLFDFGDLEVSLLAHERLVIDSSVTHVLHLLLAPNLPSS